MTAPHAEIERIAAVDRACAAAAEGRRLTRALTVWCEAFALSEPEFQVMWQLRDRAGGGFDQTTLARQLAYSPALVSATVERLRARGWLAQQAAANDRRRNLWHLSAAGYAVVLEMLRAADVWRPPTKVDPNAPNAPRREAA